MAETPYLDEEWHEAELYIVRRKNTGLETLAEFDELIHFNL